MNYNLESITNNKEMANMLEFEIEIFLNIVKNDGLVIAAKGLSMDVVIMNVIRVYCDPGNLVIVINATEFEEKYFTKKIKDDNIHSVPCSVSVTEREDAYLSGGVHFVTTRMLVVDMLKNRIPIDKITGIIVLRAHAVLESCQEAFVLRLYRQQNKTGFIKAFTNSPQSFTVGFNHVERIMRTLFVKELYIWPRFHRSVIQSLKNHEPQVIELHVPISSNVSKIQTCILDLMNLTVKELKRINKTLEMQEITVENCLTKNYHKILQNQLDCIWHQLSSTSKQLVADLKTLRHLITTLLYTDPVTFYKYLLQYRTAEYAQISTWVLQEPAELLFTLSSSLVYSGDKELNPEFCPKWKALSEILKVEIPNHIKSAKTNDNKVLVLCQDVKTGFQLQKFLTNGPHQYLFMSVINNGLPFKSISKDFSRCESLNEKYSQLQEKRKLGKTQNSSNKKLKTNVETKENLNNETEEDIFEGYRDSYLLTMSQTISESINEENMDTSEEYMFEPCKELENMDLTQLSIDKPTILIQTFKSDNFLSLQKTLEDIQPNYIVMYHSNMTAIRQIEMYEARRHRDHSLIVYFLMHNGTVEEQSYLTSLRREKEAFEFLIETNSRMVVPDDQDGKSDQCLALQRDEKSPTISTRKGDKSTGTGEKNVIIVDMREFRSELPALIHKRGIDISPVTITVGDYILTPEICVERKSLSDLVGSLNTGRLYQQCIQMSRYYAKPMLLIEFDQNRPFSWQSNYMVSTDGDNFDIQQKLLLLTLHFPKLKIVWSPSPYASAQLFEELKEKKDQPNIEYAMAIGAEDNMDVIDTKYNTGIYDFMQKLPGVTSKNINSLMKNGQNLDNLLKLSVNELKALLGNANDSKLFYSILHEEHIPKEKIDERKFKGKGKFKFSKSKKN